MARAPKTKKATSESGVREFRERKKIDYNEHKLAVAASSVPVAPKAKAKKAAAPVKKSTAAAKTKGKGTTYLVLVKRALKDVEAPGWGVESVVKYLAANNPDKTSRRHIRAALNSGVEQKLFVKTKGSYRLSKKTQDKMDRVTKKKTTKKPTTKKTTKKATTKKAATKKKTTKKTTKGAKATKKTTKKPTKKTTKKTETKEKAPKRVAKKKAESSDDEAPTPKKAKKVIGPPAGDDSTAVSEAAGVWQYYDGGWHNYVDDASRIVEGVYQEFAAAGEGSGLEIRAIQSGHFSYMVNFKDMEQSNTTTGTKRKIRRV